MVYDTREVWMEDFIKPWETFWTDPASEPQALMTHNMLSHRKSKIGGNYHQKVLKVRK